MLISRPSQIIQYPNDEESQCMMNKIRATKEEGYENETNLMIMRYSYNIYCLLGDGVQKQRHIKITTVQLLVLDTIMVNKPMFST